MMDRRMVNIKNKEQLVKNGGNALDRRARKLALNSLETAIIAADPKRIIRARLRLAGSKLGADGHVFSLDKFSHVYVIGGGKASGQMAEALEQLLGKRITNGIVNVVKGDVSKTERIKLHEASHPVPDETGVKGTQEMLEIAEKAKRDDLIVCLISGGGSSLMPMPRGEVTIADKRAITNDLLKCGATINDINTVRKHISNLKGGWLAKKAHPATILNLILSDVVGDPLDSIASGPTVPDSTTFSDAVKVLEKYRLWNTAPKSVRKILSDGENGAIPETPKTGDKAFKKVHNVVIGNNRSASQAAKNYLSTAGLNTLLLTSAVEGEARHVGTLFAKIALEISVSGNPAKRPAGILAGGETTVTVAGKGIGGRNQEISLAAAPRIDGLEGAVVASLSTDGIDGPTDAAGAIVDGKTLRRAAEAGMAPEEFLMGNDSYHFFSRIDDLILTGATGTNVNDISVMVVL